jgi:cytochrome b6-f complex iron-sulfur subunit
MADKKKMSVADILAAARKADQSGDAAPSDESVAKSSTSAAAEAAPAAEGGAPTTAGSDAPPPAKVAKPGSADRPKVSDILALARSGQAGGAKAAPAAKPAAAPAAKAEAKPAKTEKTEKPAKAAAGGAAAPVRDTASILAAARKKDKPGPMTKSEAAAKAAESPPPAAKRAAPPMPAKPAYAQKEAHVAQPKGKAVGKGGADADRRNFLWVGFGAVGAVTALWTLAVVKYMFPNVLREPPSKFKVGFPDAFPPGQVDERFKAQFGVWIVNTEYDGQLQLVALKTVCTHLGCTPNWLEAEQKYKCPCHGSGFYKDGINFEGPAPRPLERYAIRIADDGQIEVDKSKTFQEEMGQWADPASYIPV